MPGFGPVASFPVASLPSAGASGVNYTPGSVTVTYTGFAPGATFNFPPSRIYGLYNEVLAGGYAANARVYGLYGEVLAGGYDAQARVYGLYIEVLRSINVGTDSGAGFVSILW